MLKSSASILVISLALQIGCVGAVCSGLQLAALCKAERLPVWNGLLQRCASGQRTGGRHLGQQGSLLSSIYLIPQRVAMWSVGAGHFLQDEKPASKEEMRADRRAVLRKTFTHPFLHPGGRGAHGADGRRPAFGPHRQEPEQLQHGCFHDPDRCHHRQQPDGQTLG